MLDLNSTLSHMLLLIKGFQINNNDKLSKAFHNNLIKINNLMNNNNNTIINHIINNLFLIDLTITTIKMLIVRNNIIINQILATSFVLRNRYYLYIVHFCKSSIY